MKPTIDAFKEIKDKKYTVYLFEAMQPVLVICDSRVL